MVGDGAKFAYLNLSTRVLKFKYVLNFKDVLRYAVGLDLFTSQFSRTHGTMPPINFRVEWKACFCWIKWLTSNIRHNRNNFHLMWESTIATIIERPGFASRSRLREIIPANNCTMQGQNNWGNWGSPGVMKLWVAWEVLRWLMKFRELCSGGFHPKLVTPPYHGFLNVNTPPNSQNSKRH